MNKLRAQLPLQHPFYLLKIIGQVRTMDIRFFLYPHDSTHLAILGLIHHHKRLRHIAFFQVIDLLRDLGRQILVLEPTATRIGVDHQAGVHHRVLILRETDNRLLEKQTIGYNTLPNRIQTLQCIHLIGRADARTHQDVAAVDTLPFLLDELDDMIAVLRLHDTTHALGVIEVKRHIRKFRHQLATTDKA